MSGGGGGGDPFAKEEEHENHERYLVTYADMITLLMALFVVLYAMGGAGSSEELKQFAQGARDQLVNPFKGGLVGVFTYGTGKTDPEPPMSFARQSAPQKVDNTTATDLAEELNGTGSGATATVDERGVVLTVPEDALLFEPGSAQLSDAAKAVLARVVPILRNTTNALTVEGHTDATGDGNWELSARRAAVVVQALAADGIAPARLRAEGLADTRPVADNSTPEGRRKNRRVEIIVQVDFLGRATPDPVVIEPLADTASADTAAGHTTAGHTTTPNTARSGGAAASIEPVHTPASATSGLVTSASSETLHAPAAAASLASPSEDGHPSEASGH